MTPTSLVDMAGRGGLRFARGHRRLVASVVFGIVATGSLTLAYLARFEFEASAFVGWGFAQAVAVLVAIRLGVNYAFRLGIGRWRYAGTHDFLRLLAATTVGSAFFLALTVGLTWLPSVPRSVVLLEWVFSGYATGGVWVLYRLAYESLVVRQATDRRRVLVVGAGEAGQSMVHQMLRSRIGYVPVAIVDDDPFKWGTLVHGVEVVGATKDIAEIAESCAADEIVISIPSAGAEDLRRILESCESVSLPIKILPGVDEVLGGQASLTQLREIQVEDLLGRDPVRLELPELAQAMSGTAVLVTGAAGSIGSELARQIAVNSPRCLVLYDQAETPLFYLELELKELAPDVEVVPVVASITDADAFERVIERYSPTMVFHAAAYKHVPMMEHNPRSAALTNVVGTHIVGRLAAEGGAKTVVLVSTDKSVAPSNVMGASKQVAERVILSLQARYPDTAFGAVRFGNVLGSNGSVIPLFRQQLERGEPLTVTHEDATRYFMTIPEAAQLILKASLLRSFQGHVAMLDMGEPVRILDLARDLIRLSGQPFRLGENVVITGLRPGEKLHEELSAPEEKVHATEEGRVFLVETPPGFSDLPYELDRALASADLRGVLDFLAAEFPDVVGRDIAGRSEGLRVAESGMSDPVEFVQEATG